MRILQLLLITLGAVAPLFGVTIVECEDGRRVGLTPFHTAAGVDPCNPPTGPVEKDPLPADFEMVFGKEPRVEDFRGTSNPSRQVRFARSIWRTQLANWGGIVETPPGATQKSVDMASEIYAKYGMGVPVFYISQNAGVKHQWIDGKRKTTKVPQTVTAWLSAAVPYSKPASFAIKYSHHVVVGWQVKAILKGAHVEVEHPWLPPRMKRRNAKLRPLRSGF